MGLNLFDYFILLIIILGGISGYQHGLIRTLGRLVGQGLGLAAAALGCDHLALFLDDRFSVIPTAAAWLQEKLPLPVHAPSPPGAYAVYSNLAYLIIVIASFLVLYQVVSQLSNLLWTLVSWVLGWGVLGALNQVGGMFFGMGLKTLGLAFAVGLLVPLVELGSKIQMDLAVAARVYLENSIVTPYLVSIFTFCSQVLGLKL